MKIKTQERISLIVFVILTIVIFFSVFASNNQLHEIQQKQQIIDSVEKSSFELYYLENDYLVHGGTIPVERWNAKYAVLTEQLSELTLTDPSEQVILNDMFARTEELNTHFSNLVAVMGDKQGKEPIGASQELKEFYASTLAVQTQTLMSRSTELSQRVKAEALAVEQRTFLIISLSIVALMLFVLLNFLVINRSVLKSISALQTGAELIGSGDLETKIETTGNDELGFLSLTFNEMSSSLRNARTLLLTSNVELEEEITERKRVEEALRESEKQFRTIVETSQEGIIHRDNTDQILYVNKTMAQSLGYTPDEMIGKKAAEFMPADEREKHDQLMAIRRTGISSIYERKFLHRNGTVRIMNVSASPLFDLQGTCTGSFGMLIDITERKLAEEALRESEEKYRSLAEQVHEGIYIYQGDHFLFTNTHVSEMSGYSKEELLAIPFIDLIHPDDRAYIRDLAERRLRGEPVPDNYGYRFIRKDGTVRDVEAVVSAIHYRGRYATLGAARDITERKTAEDILRESEQRLNSAQRIAKVGDIIWNVETGEVVWSDALYDLMQYDKSEKIDYSRVNAEIHHPDDLERVTKWLNDCIASGSDEITPNEYRIIRKDGKILFVHTVGVIHRGKRNQVKVFVTLQDITERKREEEKLRMMQFAVDNSADTVFQITPDARLVYVNQTGCKQLGYSFEELTMMKIHDLDPDYPVEKWPAHWQQFREKGVLQFETTHHTKSGVLIPVEISANHLMFGDKEFVISFIRDITERKVAEEALKKSQIQLAEAMDLAHLVNWEFDVATGMFTFDDRFYALYGTTSDLEGGNQMSADMYAKKFVHPDDQYLVADEVNKSIQATDPGYMSQVEHRIIRRSGEIRHIVVRFGITKDKSGRTIKTQGANQDITERKLAEEALRESEEILQDIIEKNPMSIQIVDKEGFTLKVNHAHTLLFGSIPPSDFSIFADLQKKQPALEKWILLVKSGEVVNLPDIKFNAHDSYPEYPDVPVWVRAIIFPLKDKFGKPERFVFMHENITDRKHAEETIQHALAEKEILLREIHHRVKNNLAGIIALINLQTGSLPDPVQIYLFKDLETRIRSMAIVHESLYQTKDIAHISLASYTENLTRYLFQVYESVTNVRCRIDMGEITMPIETATPCGLVMTEIITNSLKYAFPKTFSCGEIRKEPCTISITMHREGNDYLLTIADNGIGIPDGTDVTMKTSLGLYLIGFIVKHQLQGSTEVSTDNGTSYKIRFPEPKRKERPTDE